MRRFLAVLALAGLVLALVAPSALATGPAGWSAMPLSPASTFNANKSLTGRLAQSDPDLLSRTDGRLVTVMIKFDLDSVASYQGGVNGLKATSPSVTGKSIKQNAKAVAAYQKYLTSQAKDMRAAIKGSLRSVKFLGTYLTAYGGVAAQIPANQAKRLLSVPGVAAVQYDALEQPLTDYDYSPAFIGAEAVWPSLGGSVFAGEGVKVGVIDSGIWPEHPMLADPGLPAPPGGPYDCDFGTSGEAGDASFTCNNKLLGAYDETATYRAVHGAEPGEYCAADQSSCSARDADGHGTHTSTTAVGDAVDSAILLGVERGPVSGIAPGASVIMYRVCLSAGCYGSDSVASVEQAILDGVDVINFSISGGANAYTDPVEIAFFDAYAAGIEVNASAGNAGPGAGTSDHAGPWTTTVGASTWDKAFSSTLHLTADGGDTLDITGVTITQGISSPTPVVLASSYSDPNAGDCYINADDSHQDGFPFPADTFTGQVVVCHRATIARIAKGYNVLQGGAAGMILYNTGTTTDLESDNHFLPAIHVNDQSQSIVDFVTGHTGVMATWDSGVLEPAQADVMASFSSRGPSGDFIKPDVTAPGVQILAGNAYQHLFAPNDGLGPNGEFYQAIAGTSMSSPHAAGTAALIKAAHPSWTPGMIKSAMMTSSVQDVVKEDGSTPADPFDDGAGSIRANRAVSPTVTFDVNPVSYVLSASDPLGRVNLNLPSINAPSMSGVITTWRTAQNVTGTQQRLHITAEGPAGTSITVSPSTLVLGPFQAKSFSVTIDASGVANGQYFGQITLNPQKTGYLNAVLPVAFKKVAGNVPLTNNCDDTSMDVGDSVNCQVTVTNLTATAANVALRVSAKPKQVLKITDFSDGTKLGNGFTWSGQLTPALAPEIIALDTPDGGPAPGYLPLSLFFDPQSGFGDETIANYNVPSFLYGDEVYSRIAVDSNGYVVVGGGTGTDNNCCAPAMPDPTRPNNVLAPYWTDLDVSAGGAVYVGILGDGTNSWLIADWESVPNWGTSQYRSFQVWIQLGATEGIWFEYDDGSWFGTPPGPGAASGLIVGAENRDGSSAATLGLDTVPSSDGYFVETAGPTPGGSITISYDVLGHKIGIGKVTALSASDVTPGISKEVVHLTVN